MLAKKTISKILIDRKQALKAAPIWKKKSGKNVKVPEQMHFSVDISSKDFEKEKKSPQQHKR